MLGLWDVFRLLLSGLLIVRRRLHTYYPSRTERDRPTHPHDTNHHRVYLVYSKKSREKEIIPKPVKMYSIHSVVVVHASPSLR
jgi:hypothetical protein